MAKMIRGIIIGGILGAVLGVLPGFVLFDVLPKDSRSSIVTNPDYYFIRNKEFIISFGCLMGLFCGGLLGAITVTTTCLLEESNRWYWMFARQPKRSNSNGLELVRPQLALEEANEDVPYEVSPHS